MSSQEDENGGKFSDPFPVLNKKRQKWREIFNPFPVPKQVDKNGGKTLNTFPVSLQVDKNGGKILVPPFPVSRQSENLQFILGIF